MGKGLRAIAVLLAGAADLLGIQAQEANSQAS
jgi:hypothetical protein